MEFIKKYTVQYGDINNGGHMSYECITELLYKTKREFFQSGGYDSEVNLGNGIGLIIRDEYFKYEKEIFLDEQIEVHAFISEIKYTSFKLNYIIFKNGNITLEGYETILAYDYTNRKVASIPPKFLNDLKKYKHIYENFNI